jgi:hypothetical protein
MSARGNRSIARHFMLAARSGNTKYAKLVKRAKVGNDTAANFRDSQ